ncbi:MAG: aminomethyl-transferring glycine dehydrogenase subunit GcvPA [Tepidanaerobacteraceae bacterium]|jgi:glycine dehydrogenase subunit 1|nr:aminomethyl-transferring glycine dehydrogenase subunit GcvPA [Tepidanaerobacteraceae bacterium]
MRYISHTPFQVKEMMDVLGISEIDELFEDIPDEVKIKGDLDLPLPLDEIGLKREFLNLTEKNKAAGFVSFMGAGAYDHYVPAVVKALVGRSEFYTAYTPYQPERSQGILAAIFEYQTMMANLTGMDVVNASMYDGASSLAEAVLMACDIKRKNKVVVSEAVHPEYVETIKTYGFGYNKEIEVVPCTDLLETDWNNMVDMVDSDTAAIVVSMPNFFGVLEDVKRAAEISRAKNIMLIVSVNPISLGLTIPPGKYGADIVTGEGQPLGSALNFGGPYLGFMAAKSEYVRRMPGRMVGETVDADGNRAFVLTLQAREQHIRREKATSNICSNEALNALAATVYMAYLGKKGLRDVAYHSHAKARYFIDEAARSGRARIINGRVFNEVVVEIDDLERKYQSAVEQKILPGVKLSRFFPGQENRLLVAFTEKRTKHEVDILLKALGVK